MKIVIEGAGEVGSHLAKMLRAEGNEVVVIDDNAERLSRLASYADVETVEGGTASIDTLKEAGAGTADLFIAVYPRSSQEVNVVCAILAKKLGAEKSIARIGNEEYLSSENRLLFKEMGIDLLFYPERMAADEIVDQLKHTAMSDVMEFAHGRLQLGMFKLDEDSPVLDLTLGEFMNSLSPEEASEFRVIAISRNDRTIMPKTDSRFFFGDMVFTISKREGLEALAARFGREEITTKSVMILGAGQITEMVARNLVKQGLRVKIIEQDREKCIALSAKMPKSVEIINGNGRNSDFLFEEGISDFDAFLALTGSDETNVLSCVIAKKFGVARTVAEIENNEYIHLAEELSVDNVINKKLVTTGRIFRYTLGGKARIVKYLTGSDAEILEYTVQPGSPITKGMIKDLKFPSDAIVGGVIRGNESFIAVGTTMIQDYDRVAIFSLPEAVKEVDRFFK